MKLAVPRETRDREQRVALVPESVKKLAAAGFEIVLERTAGERAYFPDAAYAEAGASIAPDAASLYASADLVAKVTAPTLDEVARLREGSMLLTSLMPTRHPDVVRALAARNITSFSTDTIPRTTRGQSMDTLSSMANIAGYKGVLLAALELPKYTPMFMTAAGTVLPARFFIIGAGVAGLQAIATAKRLGANVFATDVRPEVKEQIESVGAKYVGITLQQSASAGGGYAGALSDEDKKRQADLLAEQCAQSDAVITTALIGGVTAPRLITADTVRRMKPGSVVVDLAADGGGNCELSVPGSTVTERGVKILAPLNLAGTMPKDASMLWSRNLTNFILSCWKDKAFKLDLSDEILRGAVITHNGQIIHAKTAEALAR